MALYYILCISVLTNLKVFNIYFIGVIWTHFIFLIDRRNLESIILSDHEYKILRLYSNTPCPKYLGPI